MSRPRSSPFISLKLILLVGLSLRWLFVLVSDHVYHPDEIFQTLEPAYRLVFGFGLIPWDFTYGLRSYLPAFVLALPLSFLRWFGLTQPQAYVPAVALILSCLSLLVILAVYRLARHFSLSPVLAAVAAWFSAIWYELIYFAPRALTETLALDLIALALVIPRLGRPKSQVLAAFSLSLGLLLRPQYLPLGLIISLYLVTQVRWRHYWRFWGLGLASACLLYGFIDWFTLGTPFISLVNNIRLSFFTGISQAFGTQPWSYYLIAITATSSGLIWFCLWLPKIPRFWPLPAAYLSLLCLHSLIPHKEYRFLLVLAPIFCLMLALSLGRRWWLTTAVLMVSVLGISSRLPYQFLAYHTTLLARDSLFSLYHQILFQPPQCGLALPDRGWVTSGGYYRFGLNLPLYTLDYPPPASASADSWAIPTSWPPPTAPVLAQAPAFTVLTPQGKFTHPGYQLVAFAPPCLVNPTYTYQRSFTYLQPYLHDQTIYAFYPL